MQKGMALAYKWGEPIIYGDAKHGLEMHVCGGPVTYKDAWYSLRMHIWSYDSGSTSQTKCTILDMKSQKKSLKCRCEENRYNFTMHLQNVLEESVRRTYSTTLMEYSQHMAVRCTSEENIKTWICCHNTTSLHAGYLLVILVLGERSRNEHSPYIYYVHRASVSMFCCKHQLQAVYLGIDSEWS